MKKKILVTGGAGFVGGHLCERLSKDENNDVYSLDNYFTGSEENHVDNVTYIKGDTKDIKTSTLEEILDNYLPTNQEIDFLSIDVEGLDFMVLQSNNFEKYKPKVILIEILGSSLSDLDDNEITKYLKQYNYSIYAKAINTVFFIDDDFLADRLR